MTGSLVAQEVLQIREGRWNRAPQPSQSLAPTLPQPLLEVVARAGAREEQQIPRQVQEGESRKVEELQDKICHPGRV